MHIHLGMRLLTIYLSNRKVLVREFETYPRLANASEKDLLNYRLISDGIGIQWPDLDEDLSLKMFLKEEFRKNIGFHKQEAA